MAGSYIKLVWTFYERIRQIRASVLTFFGATAWAHLLQTELQSALTPSYLSHFSISNCNREPWPLLVSSGLRNYVRIHAYAYLNTQNVESTSNTPGNDHLSVVLRSRNLEFVENIGRNWFYLNHGFTIGKGIDRTLVRTLLQVATLSGNAISPSPEVVIPIFAFKIENRTFKILQFLPLFSVPLSTRANVDINFLGIYSKLILWFISHTHTV